MNNTPPRRIVFRARAQFRFLAAAIVGTLGLVSSSFASDGGAVDAGASDHILFLGLDVFVEQPDGVGQVLGVESRSTVEVVVAGSTRAVPVRRLSNFKTDLVLKVGGSGVTLAKVKAERTYSPGRDPGMQAAIQQSQMVSLQGALAQRQQMAEEKLAATTTAAGAAPKDLASTSIRNGNRDALRKVQQDVTNGMNLLGLDPSRVAAINSVDGGTFDRFEVTFEISSPDPLEDAYAIMLTVVQDPAQPKQPKRVVLFEKLPQITEKPRKVTLTQKGLPPGFGYMGYQIHVYANGREIATNLSSQRASVSTVEAFQNLFFRHLSIHRGEFLPPVIVPELLEPDLRGKLSEGDRSRTVDVKVTADGEVTSVVLGATNAPRANDVVLEKFIRNAIYFPALAAGKPVDGTATLTLGEFVP